MPPRLPVVARYVAVHAEPGSLALAERVPGTYEGAVVVPARNEAPAMLEGLAPALAGRDALAIVVVNGDANDDPSTVAANATLLAALRGSGERTEVAPGVEHIRRCHGALLLVDRASGPRRIAVGQGVGRARRIGCDLALCLWQLGKVRRRFIDTTDADVTLPPGYFDAAPADCVAFTRAFVHVPSGDEALDRATALYELTLRYYVAGLTIAGSPWAMHTIGSCISVDAEAYAAVRGVPLRAAGEDFYLLAKVAKLGPVAVERGGPICVASRRSRRVPFGTGPGVAKIEAGLAIGETPTVYCPSSFAALAAVHGALQRWAAAEEPTGPDLGGHDTGLAAALEELGVAAGVVAAVRGAKHPAQRRRRVAEWFDAFRTLKLVHALRRHGRHDVPWPEAVAALSRAPHTDNVAVALEMLKTLHNPSTPAGYHAEATSPAATAEAQTFGRSLSDPDSF
ncbi:MAG: hypothetical protein AAF721_41140 [Myxococcota bacterium]